MNPNSPPNFTGTYPLGGERIGPAWRTAWRALATTPGKWHPAETLAEAMAQTGILDKTARGLLARARAAGVLDVRHRMTGTPRRRRAEYRPAG